MPPSMENSRASLSASRHTDAAASTSRASSRRRAESDDSDKAGRVWARTVDEAWLPCILSLDGGGIRGYSSLLILKELMHEVWLCEERLEKEDSADITSYGVAGAMDSSAGSTRRDSVNQDTAAGAEPGEDVYTIDPGPTYRPAQPSPLTNPVELPLKDAPGTLALDELTAPHTMRKAFIESELLPCHYFDFMYGTSTGGLIATMLGRLRMTVSECLELYRKVGDDLFGKRRSSLPLTTKYYHEPLEKAVQDIVGNRCHEHDNCDGKEDLHPFPHYIDPLLKPDTLDVDQPRLCQSCCLTATHTENFTEAYLLRTYPHYYSENTPNWINRYNEGADQLKIWQVTRATSAAPFYFRMLEAEVAGQRKGFKDGGIRENNPSSAALSEFNSLYADKAEQPALLLSVGTGRPDMSVDGFAAEGQGPLSSIPFIRSFLENRAIIRNLLINYTEGEKQHDHMRNYAKGEHSWYKRLNVSHGLQDMPLDSWERGSWQGQSNVSGGASLTKMEEKTRQYLLREFDPDVDSYAPPNVMLKQAAEKLVRQRRAREQIGGKRWDTFVGKFLHVNPAQVHEESTGACPH